MKRLLSRALVVVGVLAVTFALLEVGYRIVLSAKGESHSATARRAGYIGQLDWIVRPHGPIAMGSFEFEEASEEDLGRPIEGAVLSPYLGVERVALMETYVPGARYFETPEADSTFDVVIVGGSVAAILAADEPARAEIESVLSEDPRLAGRPIRIHGQARPGFKAPQTSILCDLLFQLGWRPDLIVLLDGFNEVALANENRRMGGHPLYPPIPTWAHLAPDIDTTSTDIDRLVEMELAQREARRLLERTVRWGLYRSAIASRLMDALISRPTARHSRALRDLELRRNDGSMPLALRGPAAPDGLDEALAGMIDTWRESSISLDAACDARGIPFLHVLQPTLYDPGAKPISKNEKRRCLISDEWREGVVGGYPLLREAGAELVARDVDFRDASRIFADWEGDLYYDSCHVAPAGSLEIAKFIAREARALPHLAPADR
ncbi:MAG: hypothetical protein AAGA20_16315 [Planctomycetota bacterium]